jgi:hypothetical protein
MRPLERRHHKGVLPVHAPDPVGVHVIEDVQRKNRVHEEEDEGGKDAGAIDGDRRGARPLQVQAEAHADGVEREEDGHRGDERCHGLGRRSGQAGEVHERTLQPVVERVGNGEGQRVHEHRADAAGGEGKMRPGVQGTPRG